MPELTIEVGSQSSDLSRITRYTGEAFTLVLAWRDRESGAALDVSDADLSLTLGSIRKASGDFTCPYDTNNSKCSVDITSSDTASEGVFVGQATAVIDAGRTVKSHPIRLVIASGGAAITLEDLRASLWDFASVNPLSNDEEFPDELLMQARRQAIDEWNAQPGTHTIYTISNFPARWVGAWRKGAQAEALQMKARNLAGNRMAVSAGGISVDETGDRIVYYTGMAKELKQEWLVFIRTQQYADAMRSSFQELSG